ncbi:type II toxin-antitoxin system VapC family toxin [Cyanobium sp. Morenito 9A2]|uniref:type II toxin-antitoxin system VapC family toxin n=1 Tax=Cyanobium sp. Morenito 9A2 TaxID=2823718 RepID=UPI0020CF4313|nr:type II toxin-antitoxin system VapC family toxin [Cyanobium sp. Morenito 9A2]MCP9850224.1 type II toxin-antitoxin system VapC family toxin [Cyanobium sp. Morenito 9A2]
MIDTSVLLAVLFQQPGAPELEWTLVAAAPKLLISAATRPEATLVAEGHRFGASGEAIDSLIEALAIDVVPFGDDQLVWALRGWRQFRKGRQPAGLNLGVCFSCGLAMARDLPLLFKGHDFGQTEVKTAALILSPDPSES